MFSIGVYFYIFGGRVGAAVLRSGGVQAQCASGGRTLLGIGGRADGASHCERGEEEGGARLAGDVFLVPASRRLHFIILNIDWTTCQLREISSQSNLLKKRFGAFMSLFEKRVMMTIDF